VIIPLCNEEESLPLLWRSLETLQSQLGAEFEVHYLLVDDGSTDATLRLLPQSIPAGVSYTIVAYETNRGLGAALRTGFEHSRGADIVCTIDADCTYGPEHLVSMIHEVSAGKTDVVVASPYHPQGLVEGVQPWRLVLSKQCSRLYRLVSPLQLHTYTSIFRVYSGSYARQAQIWSDDFISAVELVLYASALGFRVSEMPLTLHRRTAGVSKMKILKTIRGHAALILVCLTSGRRGFTGYGGGGRGSWKALFSRPRPRSGFSPETFPQQARASKRSKVKKLGAI
jgi:dolichol-phosphate mannosyltransferase